MAAVEKMLHTLRTEVSRERLAKPAYPKKWRYSSV